MRGLLETQHMVTVANANCKADGASLGYLLRVV